MTNQIRMIVYADEVTIMANGKVTLIKAMKRIDKEARELKLEINESKTNYLRQTTGINTDTPLIMQNYKLKLITAYNYLKVTVERADKKSGRINTKRNQAYERNQHLLESK